jgi:hypothetical protein
MEVYIDDIVIKSAAHKSHLANLRLAFERMRHYGLKMNPLKCAFQAPTCKKDLQKFLKKVNYLKRFIANLSGKIIPFTPILKLKDESEFTWGQNKRHLRR